MESARIPTAEEVAATYFQAWRNGDIDRVRPLLHPDVNFVGAMGSTDGADETLSGLAGMFAMTRQVEVVKRWADGPDVLTWFELRTETAGPQVAARFYFASCWSRPFSSLCWICAEPSSVRSRGFPSRCSR